MFKPGQAVIANVDRLNRYMDRNDLAAVAVRSGVNFTYLAGMAMPGTLMRHLDVANTVRGFMLLWPREAEPSVVLDSMAEKVVKRDSWINRVELYQAYVESLYSRVVMLLEEYGLANKRVGFEQSTLSAAHWLQIQSALPNMKMIDISQMMDEVRWIKTPGEIALQKKSRICSTTRIWKSFRRSETATASVTFMPALLLAASGAGSRSFMGFLIPVQTPLCTVARAT